MPITSDNNITKMTTTDYKTAAVSVAHDATAAAAQASTRLDATPSTATQHGQLSATTCDVQADFSTSTAATDVTAYTHFHDDPVFAFEQATTLTRSMEQADGNTYRALPDDFFSSPEFTDPSPALTNALSFGVDSCNTSPLLTDNYDAPEYASMSLFGGSAIDFSALLDASSKQLDTTGSALSPPRRAAQNAFNAGRKTDDDAATVSTLQLLQALSSAGFSASDVVRATDQALGAIEPAAATPSTTVSPLMTVIDPVAVTSGSPSLFSSPSYPTLSSVPQASTSLFAPVDERALSPQVTSVQPTSDVPAKSQSSAGLAPPRGVKRRLDTGDLLPIDAPIQPRKYRMPSATSRKDSSEDVPRSSRDETPAHGDDATSSDPVISKRLSNTLAARRSRHRKAEELRELHDQIAMLTAEVDLWKQRCHDAEQQRDEALSHTL